MLFTFLHHAYHHNLQSTNTKANFFKKSIARPPAHALPLHHASVRRKQRLSDQYEINVPTLHLITFKYCTAHFKATKTLKYDSGNCKSIKKLSRQWFLTLLPVFFMTSRCNHNKILVLSLRFPNIILHKTADRLTSVLNHNIEFSTNLTNQSFFSRRKKNGRIKCWSFGKDSCRHSCKIGKNFWTYFILYNKSVLSFISFFNVGHFFEKICRKNSVLMSTMNCRTTSWFWWPIKKLKSKWKTICHYFCIIMPMFSQIGFKIFWTNWNRLPQPAARKKQVFKNYNIILKKLQFLEVGPQQWRGRVLENSPDQIMNQFLGM